MDRLLVLVSWGWLAALVRRPELAYRQEAYSATVTLIAVNALACLWTLTRRRRVLVVLNCTQIVLFGMLSFQLYAAYGAHHYQCDREPRALDWAEFTAAHVLRAADLLHALGEYGVRIQNITHNSQPAGVILLCMHLAVDVFLLGLLLRWAAHYWRSPPRGTALARERRIFSRLLLTVALFVAFGTWQKLEAHDWLLWPLENLLRLLDVGDAFQIFHWRLHGVEANVHTRTAAILFRLVAAVWLAKLVLLLRVTVFRTWGLSVEELTDLLTDGTTAERRGAAWGLGWSGPDAVQAVTALAEALRAGDPEVRWRAARSLGRVGAAATAAVEPLAAALWKDQPRLCLEAVRALGRIGPEARPAVDDLCCLWKVSGRKLRREIIKAIRRIVSADVRDPELLSGDSSC